MPPLESAVKRFAALLKASGFGQEPQARQALAEASASLSLGDRVAAT
jgi:hypothetical protein